VHLASGADNIVLATPLLLGLAELGVTTDDFLDGRVVVATVPASGTSRAPSAHGR
jgi:hypothetical protein